MEIAKVSFFMPLKVLAPVAGTVLLGLTAAPTNAQTSEQSAISVAPSSTDRNRQIIQDGFHRWATEGVSLFGDILSPDIVWTIEGSGPSAWVFRGRDEFVERAVRPFQSRLSRPVRPVSHSIWADGDHVIVYWKGEGTARDGQSYHNAYAWIFHMRDGKAVEVTAFLDLVPYDAVLNRVPAPANGDL